MNLKNLVLVAKMVLERYFFPTVISGCIYCQNYEISQLGNGREISVEELATIFLQQQEKGVNNINLVTPTMYAFSIIEAIKIAKKNRA